MTFLDEALGGIENEPCRECKGPSYDGGDPGYFVVKIVEGRPQREVWCRACAERLGLVEEGS